MSARSLSVVAVEDNQAINYTSKPHSIGVVVFVVVVMDTYIYEDKRGGIYIPPYPLYFYRRIGNTPFSHYFPYTLDMVGLFGFRSSTGATTPPTAHGWGDATPAA